MFSRTERIRFQHCDPAGIVFYPRYIEMINATVEDWFDSIGIGFAEIHGSLNTALPAVALSIDFRAPSRLGEMIVFTLDVERLGTTSLGLRIEALHADELRFSSSLTLVHTSKEDYRPRPWPAAFRSAIEPNGGSTGS